MVLWLDVLLQYIWVNLNHVRFIRSDGSDVAAFLTAFGVGQVGCGKQGGERGRCAEYDAASADRGFQEPFVLVVRWSEDLDFGARKSVSGRSLLAVSENAANKANISRNKRRQAGFILLHEAAQYF